MNTRKKPMPKRLGTDLLKDAIVCLDFTTVFNQEKIKDDVLACVNGMGLGEFLFYPNERHEANGDAAGIGFVANEVYKIRIEKDRLLFNFVTSYRGWDDYGRFIRGVMSALEGVVTFVKITMQCIDVLHNTSVVDKIDGDIHFNQFQTFYDTNIAFSCRSHNEDGYEGVVSVKITEKKPQLDGSLVSYIDVRVESPELKGKKNDELSDWLEYCHITQKDMFFCLLKDEFINQLEPEYD